MESNTDSSESASSKRDMADSLDSRHGNLRNFESITNLHSSLQHFKMKREKDVDNGVSSHLTPSNALYENSQENVFRPVSSFNMTPKKALEESSGFMEILNVSDLERDELYCKQNWSYLPVQKVNFSLTNIDNSKINPPNFMPAEDSLFQDLKSTFSNSLAAISEVSGQNTSGTSRNTTATLTGAETHSPDKVNVNTSFNGVPSLEEISFVLRKCDQKTNPMDLMDKILKAGDKCFDRTDHTASTQNTVNIIKSRALNIPTYSELSNNSMGGADDFTPDLDLTFEDDVIFTNVDIGKSLTLTFHLVNRDTNEQGLLFEYCLDGDEDFSLSEKSYDLSHRITRGDVVLKQGVKEICITFRPRSVGPAKATITVVKCESKKKINISGWGGKPHLLMEEITSSLDVQDEIRNIMLFNEELKSNFQLENVGLAPAFYWIHLGGLQLSCVANSLYGIIHPGGKKSIHIAINRDKGILASLLNFFSSSEEIKEIGKVSFEYGDESTRQRLRRICTLNPNHDLTYKVNKELPYLIYGFLEEFPLQVESLVDHIESVPLLMHDGIKKTYLSLKVKKSDLLKFTLKTMNIPK